MKSESPEHKKKGKRETHNLTNAILTVQRALSAKVNTREVSRVVASANLQFRRIEESNKRFRLM